MTDLTPDQTDYAVVRAEIVALLVAARSVNTVITAIYWDVGRCIASLNRLDSIVRHTAKHLIVRLSADLSGESAAPGNLETVPGHALGPPL
jgi:hypothetical protein